MAAKLVCCRCFKEPPWEGPWEWDTYGVLWSYCKPCDFWTEHPGHKEDDP